MSRQHGADCRVYIGGRDASGDVISITPKFTATTHDTTTMASGNWMESDVGLMGWDAEVEAFYDPAAGGVGRQMESLLGADGVISIYDGDADAIGDRGILLSNGVLESRSQPISVGDLVKLSGTFKGNGRPGLFGTLLHPKGEETATGTESSHDNGAASAAGYRATLHVTAITGSWTVKIQQSSDNGVGDAWADLVTFTQVAAAGGVIAETKEGSGAVERYLRVTSTEDVAGTIEFVCGLARY